MHTSIFITHPLMVMSHVIAQTNDYVRHNVDTSFLGLTQFLAVQKAFILQVTLQLHELWEQGKLLVLKLSTPLFLTFNC